MTNKLFLVLPLTLGAALGASLPPDSRIQPAPTAIARISGGEYCFEHERRIDVEREPPSFVVLKLKIQVAYHNAGARPLIIPIDHEHTVYTAMREGVMNQYREPVNLDSFNPSLKAMSELPAKVSPDNPLDPKNDSFAIIPARGDLVSPIVEDVMFPVNHKTLFHHDPDLRGKKIYIRLELNQQDLNPSLLAQLSDRWTKFGVPWTGSVMTNVMTVNVPRNPTPSGRCVDAPFEHPGNKAQDVGK